MEKARELASIIKRAGGGEDIDMLRKEAQKLLVDLELRDITGAQRYLIESCLSNNEIHTMVCAFASILGDQSALLRASLSLGHPVRKILAEHEMFEIFLADLAEASQEIQTLAEISEFSAEYRKLNHAVEHLQAIDIHNQREELLIFPALQGHPCYSITKLLSDSHERINNVLKTLNSAIKNFRDIETAEFKSQVNALATVIVPIMREHIFQEDNIFLPAVLDIITDNKIWYNIKAQSDQMGYCAFEARPYT